jgi:ammonium transporter, Amt family
MFAAITPALITGAFAERKRFGAFVLFIVLWSVFVYSPLAHWVWAPGGWLRELGALDFAGGTVVHISSGVSALVAAVLIGRRWSFGETDRLEPHDVPMTVLGAGLLWFGWFGFNAGSAVAADNTAAVAWVNTLAATAAAALGWLATERLRDGHATSLGAASGVVAGLVAITPACSALSPVGAIVLGIVAGALCALAVGLKYRLGYDDSLDVVGVHLVGGLVGTLGVGFLATAAAPAGVDGLLYGGGADQLWRQAVGAVAVLAFSFAVTLVIGILLQRTIGFRIDEEHEVVGIDLVVHAETGYDLHAAQGAANRPQSAITPVVREAVGSNSRAGEDRAGEDRAGEDRAGEDRAGEDRAGEDRAGEDNTAGEGTASKGSVNA